MMKRHSALLAVSLISLFNVRCSDWGKEPATGFDQLNANARSEQQQVVWEKANPKQSPPPNVIYVKQEVEVTKEVAAVDGTSVIIAVESDMDFDEGKSMTYKIRASTTMAGLKFDLRAEGLPQGASLTKSDKEKDTYLLSWTPSYSIVLSGHTYEKIKVKFYPDFSKSSDPAALAKVKGLALEKTATLRVNKNQEAPSDIKIESLPTEIGQGQMVKFAITAKVPGFDKNSLQKPTLVVAYDNVAVTSGNKFQEMDGSRHVVTDLSKKEAEYLGDSKWKFYRTFDTRYIEVQPQLDLDGKVIEQADGTRVRVSFKVFNGNGVGTEALVAQVKIKYAAKPAAAPSATPTATPKASATPAKVESAK